MNKLYLLGWLAIFVQMGVLEYLAVRRDLKGDTLSELIWGVMAVHPVIWFAVGGVLVWALIHFLTRGWV